ncbi:Transcription factor [Aspergillus sp. HF37]|nr:Transcription factor [Aspergillus sp. HF37]
MQDQISDLSATVHSLTNNDPSAAVQRLDSVSQPATGHRPFGQRSSAKELKFQGPTTFGFSFDLAKSSLQRRGIVERNEIGGADTAQEPSPMPSPQPPDHDSESARSGDPLWSVSKEEALRLCRLYEEEMGIMYPVLELPQLLNQVHLLYDPTNSVATQVNGDTEGLERTDVHILRLVFACALTAEESGRSELAMRLVESVREVADNCVWGPSEIKNIIFLTLMAIFYFQMDEETLAWRTIGIVERMCLEKGLHRRETLNQPAVVAAGRDRVLRLFWSIYILDMRWSFGTGMPFSLEDSDIDPWLPEPEEKMPYLRVMIRYSRIAAKVWKFISAFNNSNEINKDDMHYLDWQVLRWGDGIPGSLRLGQPSSDHSTHETRSLRRLRCLLYLRANQLRILIHRPVLHSAAHITRYPSESETVVDIAKDSIRFIARLNDTSDIYQLQQVTFNWFLVSALAVLFLAVAQAPSQFSNHCREEFYMALELVRGFSTKSYISRRLWKSIRSLRRLGPQLGLQKQRHGEPLPRADTDPADIVGTMPNPLDQAGSSSIQSHTPRDGEQMTQELMEWFEAVGNLENQIMGMGGEPFEVPGLGPFGSRTADGGYMFDYGGELSSMMKDCF